MFGSRKFVAKYTRRRGYRDLQLHLGEMNGVMEKPSAGREVVKASAATIR
jgi:hypothetical protein